MAKLFLYQLTKGQKFRIMYGNELLPEVLTFDRIDGFYSICFDTDKQIAHIAAYAEVRVVP